MATKKQAAKQTAIKIEKGVPVPECTAGGTLGPVTIALRAMAVGDSILLDGNVSLSMRFILLRPKRFSRRKQPDGKYRVWRVE